MSIPTVIDAGTGHAATTLRVLGTEERAAVVFDARVPAAASLASGAAHPGQPPIALEHAAADLTGLGRRLRRAAPSVVIAIGGGSTLDAVKLATLACTEESLLRFVLQSTALRSVTRIPPVTRIPVVAVPTTVGTSSDVNAVAVATTAHGHRLTVGEALRPRFTVIDGELLRSLSPRAVREGCFESLLRVIGRATGTAFAPAAVTELAVALVRAGDGALAAPAARVHIARLTAATQRPVAGLADPFAMKHWYVANEVSFATGARKIPATVPVVAAVWARIEAGDARWGVRAGLRRVWRPVAHAARLPDNPADGILALARRWGIRAAARPADLDAVADRVERAWGGVLPPLRGLRRADILDVLQTAAWPEATAASATPEPRSSPSEGGEHT